MDREKINFSPTRNKRKQKGRKKQKKPLKRQLHLLKKEEAPQKET